MNPLISIIIPVYNESESIPLLFAELKNVFTTLPNYRKEIIFVDDGSKDNSIEIIKNLAINDPDVKYLEFSKNFGKEIATTAGLNFATGDAVLMIDADLQHPPRLIPEFIKKWEAGAEVVVGVKTGNKGQTWLEKCCSALFYKTLNLIANVKVTPHASDFRLLDRKVVNEFNRFTERARMTRALVSWLGFKKDFVYFEADKRVKGKVNYTFGKLFHLAINSFISLSLIPLKLAAYLGCFIVFIFGFFGLYLILGKYIFKWSFALSFTGTAQLAILLVFLVGIILLCLGLIVLYVANIHNEVIGRPLYVIRDKKI